MPNTIVTVEHEGARCLELRCSPYAQNSALQPVIEHLQRTLQFWLEDSADEKRRKLIVGATGRSLLQEQIPLLAALLSLPHPEGYPPLTFSPQKQKEKTQEALVAWLCSETRQQAMTYAWEDLHWADPSTLEFITLLLAQVPTTRLLAVLTYRPESRRVGNAHQPVSIAESVTVGHAHPTGESEAEACFLKAIEIAQSQKAKSWELRAATSLARLWQQQGKRTEAHKLLSEVYNWFTEGFDTKDLQEAKALLEELAG